MIYFAELADGLIKIGYTSIKVVYRINALEEEYGQSFRLLAIAEGERCDEKALHRRFAHLRCFRMCNYGFRRELFYPEDDLLDFIGNICSRETPEGYRLFLDNRALIEEWRPCPTVTFDRALFEMAEMVASDRGISLTEFLTEILTDPVRKAYISVLRKLPVENP